MKLQITKPDSTIPSSSVSTVSVPFSIGNATGSLEIAYSDQGIHRITRSQQIAQKQPIPTSLQPLTEALAAYASGERVDHWPATVLLSGSPFVCAAWQQIAAVPYGHTISYTELAKKAGNAAAVRAVASACARNPAPILIPCHRIIAKDGTLGGFAWGLESKRALLALEQQAVLNAAA